MTIKTLDEFIESKKSSTNFQTQDFRSTIQLHQSSKTEPKNMSSTNFKNPPKNKQYEEIFNQITRILGALKYRGGNK